MCFWETLIRRLISTAEVFFLTTLLTRTYFPQIYSNNFFFLATSTIFSMNFISPLSNSRWSNFRFTCTFHDQLLNWYVSWPSSFGTYFRRWLESRQFMSESTSTSSGSDSPQYWSVFQCLISLGNRNLVSTLVVVDQKSKVMDFFVFCKIVMFQKSQMNRFDICEKRKVPWQFKIKHAKNKIIVVGQWKIAVNIPTQVYLAIL